MDHNLRPSPDGRCHCCHLLAALLHALAGPSCALKVVRERAFGRGPSLRLYDRALARLLTIWQQGLHDQANVRHGAPCRACGEVRCRF